MKKDYWLDLLTEYDRAKYKSADRAARAKFRRHLRKKARAQFSDRSKKRIRKVGLR